MKTSVSAGIFFFQAEDGIRDEVRSRGLGEVYKGQRGYGASLRRWRSIPPIMSTSSGIVSYTHLTLPTNREALLSVVAVFLKKSTAPSSFSFHPSSSTTTSTNRSVTAALQQTLAPHASPLPRHLHT